jgi:1,4-alpha-glucan branching enzyme
MKKFYYIFIIFLLISFVPKTWSQVVTTSPSFPTENNSVTITFNASLGTGGLAGFTGEVYAHTGVITSKSSSDSDWKYAPSKWGDNNSKYKLTSLGNNKWQLNIGPNIREYYGVPAGEEIQKMAFVFRSKDSSKEGKGDGGTDIFVNVSQTNLNARFNTPTNNSVIEIGESINISISASGNENLRLLINGVENTTTTTNSINKNITYNTAGDYQLVAIATSGTKTAKDTINFVVRNPNINQARPSGLKNGINYNSNTSVTLQLYAPHKENIFVFGSFNNWIMSNQYQMKKDGDYFWLTINNLTANKEYIYQYIIDGTIKIADPYTDKVLDPWNDKKISSNTYPNLIPYPTGKTTGITSVLQTGQTAFNWTDSSFKIPKKDDLVIYELHIRDFTSAGNIKTVTDTLNYLQRLGVNAIELMPFNEFEGNDSWGYNPSFYFAPDKAYGTKNDYKKFINECHKRGIAVIMDMVLNHSFGQSPLAQMYLEGGKPSNENPWYNRTHNFENPDAQWGYDFNHESQATKDLVDQINSYWMTEYHIDGFRFDFTKGFSNTFHSKSSDSWGSKYDKERIKILKRMFDEIRKVKANAPVIIEHLSENSEEKELANYGFLMWGNINHNYSEATMGYTENGKSDLNWASWKSRGWNTANLISYMESHDEERLMAKNLKYGKESGNYSTKDLNIALKRMETAAAFYLTIPGPKMIWQFGEVGYDVSIDENGRTGRKPIHWEYKDIAERQHLFQTYAALIKLKKEEDAFQSTNFTLTTRDALKRIEINHTSMDVRIIGNFDVQAGSISPKFSKTGTWYDYFTGTELSVSNINMAINLAPGEFKIFTTKKLTKPNIPSAPIASNLSITGKATVGQELTASYNYSDADNDIEAGSIIQWYVSDDKSGQNEIAIPSANNLKYTIASTYAGKYIRFSVVPKNNATKFATGTKAYSPYSDKIEAITGIDDVLKKELRLYPNPIQDILHINNIKDVNSIQIYNLAGKSILNLSHPNQSLDLNLSHLNSGIYIIVFQAKDNTRIVRKIIKQ